jgi:hypothetical protein
MAEDRDGRAPEREGVSAGRDGYVAERDLDARSVTEASVSGSQGVQISGTQFNFFMGGDPGARQSAGSAAGPAGQPLGEVRDPFALEVHPPVRADDAPPGLPVLPAYVPRDHDQRLRDVVRAAAGGTGGVAVLVGGSSTGKTRACWEAIGLLREQAVGWRLWHPIDPGRPEAALRDLNRIGPRTVVWLNEAQLYLLTADGTGERVAAGLRELLRDPARGPVLVLATLWPQYWGELTSRPSGRPDGHAQARELLSGGDIRVPPALTAAELKEAAGSGDPRLRMAARGAGDGRVVQFLAGARELISRYDNALPAERALLEAAVDARRLGMGPLLPRAFLEEAAPGYIAEADWYALAGDWPGQASQALARTAEPARGIPGPLAPVVPRAGGDPAPAASRRLADYLEQVGATERLDVLPPREFWEAARRHAAPGDLPVLARHAESRGLYHQGALLRIRALACGKDLSIFRLLTCLGRVDPHSLPEAAGWIADRMDLSQPSRVHAVLGTLEEAGRADLAGQIAERAAGKAALTDLSGVDDLLRDLRRFGRGEALAALAIRAAGQADPPIMISTFSTRRCGGRDLQTPSARSSPGTLCVVSLTTTSPTA